ncbi:glycosyltransferase [Enterococcus sp. AZ046]|uniref:glycosyltransferase n=1 Tax=Enterococcus sp. AZ046 TaxID=2774685 RepID=UPI003D2E92A7
MNKTKVNVLLSYYNGEKYIVELINSIKNQEGSLKIKIIIRNDGSDKVLDNDLLYEDVEVINCHNIGVKMSFLKLIELSDDDAEYFCFCDQDDIWDTDKIISAIKKLETSNDRPSLYFGKTRLVDNNKKYIGEDSFEKGVFSFGRTLIKNNAIGCTMVFNKKLRDLVRTNTENYKSFSKELLHDHLLYMICLGMDGFVYYDEFPHINYRQHTNNVVGGTRTFIDKIKSNGLIGKKNVRLDWVNELYANFGDVLTNENRNLLLEIIKYRSNIRQRIKFFFLNPLPTKSLLEKLNISLLFLLGKY